MQFAPLVKISYGNLRDGRKFWDLAYPMFIKIIKQKKTSV